MSSVMFMRGTFFKRESTEDAVKSPNRKPTFRINTISLMMLCILISSVHTCMKMNGRQPLKSGTENGMKKSGDKDGN